MCVSRSDEMDRAQVRERMSDEGEEKGRKERERIKRVKKVNSLGEASQVKR
jgi:hypothetical protein